MKTVELFEYPCPECGLGTVRTTQVLNYKTKIKGYPFVVDNALIGVCDQCQAEFFAPEETKQWEERFYRLLEARRAFLAAGEITELRKTLGLSMEDFARLIGCTRQSIYTWEKPERASPPSRMADLLMKLVQHSLEAEPVDILTVLLEEAKKWGVVIEFRRSSMRASEPERIVLRPTQVRRSALAQQASERALAADAGVEEEKIITVETSDGKTVGALHFDSQEGALVLDIINAPPPLKTVDVEIVTRDGQQVKREQVSLQQGQLPLLENTDLREGEIVQIVLNRRDEEKRG